MYVNSNLTPAGLPHTVASEWMDADMNGGQTVSGMLFTEDSSTLSLLTSSSKGV